MDKQKYLDDIQEIRQIMEKSSRFISLSGTSGILSGIFALAATFFAYVFVYRIPGNNGYYSEGLTPESIMILLTIAVATLLLALGAAILFTFRKAQKDNQNVWDLRTKRLIINLSIPLATGGILCLMLLLKGFIGFVAPLTLVFYGLALINASRYTLNEIRSLGLLEIVIGLLAVPCVNLGLLFWALGFGIIHIIYGLYMQRKYGS